MDGLKIPARHKDAKEMYLPVEEKKLISHEYVLSKNLTCSGKISSKPLPNVTRTEKFRFFCLVFDDVATIGSTSSGGNLVSFLHKMYRTRAPRGIIISGMTHRKASDM